MNIHALGIDISKLKLNACLLKSNEKTKHKVFTNNREGFEQLSERLIRQNAGNAHVCLEATGIYGEALALFSHHTEYQVSVVNPAGCQSLCWSRVIADENR